AAAAEPESETESTTEPGTEIVVHVSGAVGEPGVVRLPGRARVDDALRAAGGATEEADLSAVNLARPLADGEQIHVPVPGEEPRTLPDGPADAAAEPSDSADGAPIDLNTADAAELEELPGVGPAIAQRILEHREKNGPFTCVGGLLEVAGIGPATHEEMRGSATVGGAGRCPGWARRALSGSSSTGRRTAPSPPWTGCWRSPASGRPPSRRSADGPRYDARGPAPAAGGDLRLGARRARHHRGHGGRRR